MLKGTGLVLGGLAMPGVLEACLTAGSSTGSTYRPAALACQTSTKV